MSAEHPALASSRQLLLVISPDGNSSSGKLYRYERAQPGEPWQLQGAYPVSLGKTGLAWGTGLHGGALGPGPAKHEGDQKSPAGIFILGPAFGYAPQAESGVQDFPYRQITEKVFGIEDPKSTHYNTIVDASTIAQADWQAADHMLRLDGLYRYGVMVQHNPFPGVQESALGSCIFIHVWRGAGQATVGCTATEQKTVAELLTWLREPAQPRLVQLTAADYDRFRDEWGLPVLPQPPPLTFIWFGLAAVIMAVGAWLYARRHSPKKS